MAGGAGAVVVGPERHHAGGAAHERHLDAAARVLQSGWPVGGQCPVEPELFG